MLLPISHLVYVPDVAAEFDLMFDAVEHERVGRQLLVDYSRPRVHRVRGMNVDVTLTSFTEGTAGVDVYFCHAALKPGDIVLDLGANCGLFSMACAARVGVDGLVIAVEPDPLNCAALRDNLRRHDITNVRVVEAAVWSCDGGVRFGSDGSLGSLVLPEREDRGHVVERQGTTIDTLVRGLDPARISLVKMDIEGAEYEALTGAQGLLERGTATWLTEIHFDNATRRVAPERVERCFDAQRYKVSRVQQGAAHAYPLVVARPRNRNDAA